MKINSIGTYKATSPVPQNQQKVSFKRDGGCTIAGGPSSDEFLKSCGVADEDRKLFINDPVIVLKHDNKKAWFDIDKESEFFHRKYDTIKRIIDMSVNIEDPKEAALSAEYLRRVRSDIADGGPSSAILNDGTEVDRTSWEYRRNNCFFYDF